ncbi:Gibberellin regulated protein [Quillaja saponaria]|uniref:Gibberellin regulated protein n=1 Tax=Quillaja saponaria TaxID=32244 RepID=A0AAD7M3R5_QUISA|nr:Gibberellin regulated protein [Quillaja saponaria]
MENHATSLTEEANYLVVSQHKAHGDLIIPQAPTPQPQQNYSHFPMHGITEGSLQPQECGPRCTGRCSKTAYKKPCMFFCQKCCAKCLCVPPGTYGNKQFCPCYNNWKTKRGGPKCP